MGQANRVGLGVLFLASAFLPAVEAQVCTFSISLAPAFVDAAAQNASLTITASDPSCASTVTSSGGFATTPTGAAGNGTRTVTIAIAANATGAERSSVISAGGQSVNLTQRFTTGFFNDVLPDTFYFDAVSLLRTRSITAGTSINPPLYSPESTVTRGQMAVFIVRTMLSTDNFAYPSTPYFTDVPANYPFFKWIQKLRELNVTAGTSATTYGPDALLTRGQMAVFIIRARLDPTAVFPYSATPYFTDVPATHPFFSWIQKMRDIGVTAGCGNGTTYCADDAVTRGQMAIFLMRGGFNQLLGPTAPQITTVAPPTGIRNQTTNVTITALNTHFTAATQIVMGGAGITVGAISGVSATSLTVPLTVAANATLGARSVTARTGAEEATLPNGFTVITGGLPPVITSFAPAQGAIGTSVTITGSDFISAGVTAEVRLARSGGGIVAAPVTASSNTSLTFVIPSTAVTGIITVGTPSGSANSATPLTVIASSSFTLTAVPPSLTVFRGQGGSYAVRISTPDGFGGLADLSVTGLPAGVTATFAPTKLSVGQTSVLLIQVPAGQTLGNPALTITGSATMDGLPLSASQTVTLVIQAVTTSFIGRTVVDDAQETPLAGVVVKMLGKNGTGGTTGCTGTATSDSAGNFVLSGLAANCAGPQLISYDGSTVTSPPGKYAGVNLVYTLVANQVTPSPVLVHLPRIDNKEVFYIQQNSPTTQNYSYSTIPGLSVTVYAGTTFTAPDGTNPNPFPLIASFVPPDRLPDNKAPVPTMMNVWLVSFSPANSNASAPVAVTYPNAINTPPGTGMTMMTLDPTRGLLIPYGTATVSSDGLLIIPDFDPARPGKRFGISHFDWHAPMPPPPPDNNPPPDPCGPKSGKPVDLASGVEVMTSTDMVLNGSRGSIMITRTYRTLSNLAGPFGIGTSHDYDYALDTTSPQNAQLVNFILPTATRIPFARQANGTLINLTTPMMRGAVMTTTANGTAVLRWPTGTSYTFVPGTVLTGSVLIEMKDPNGNVTTINRVPNNPAQIAEIVDPVGRKLTFVNDSANRITSITDLIGRVVRYTYDGSGRLATFTNVLGGVTQYLYDAQGRLSKVTDPRGVVLAQNTYDSNGRVIQQIVAGGGVFLYEYTLVNPLVPTSPVMTTKLTDPRGNSTLYRFNPQGFIVSATDPNGQTRYFDRELSTNLLIGERGSGTCQVCGTTSMGDRSYTYDANGNRLTETDALGNKTTYTYEPVFNKVTSIKDALGNQTNLVYDSRGNLISFTDPRGNAMTFTYNALGLLTEIQDPGGRKTKFTYDAQGNQIKVTNALNQDATFNYDAASRIVEQVSAIGERSTLGYNALDQLLAMVEATGRTTQVTYDAAGFLASYTDPRGANVQYTYDIGGRLISRKDAASLLNTYTYDVMNNMIGVTNRRGQPATLGYDSMNRLVLEQYVDAKVDRTYDAAGRLTRVVDSASGTFAMSYDLAGRLIRSVGPYGSVTYTRDADGRVASRQVQGQGRVDYTYDPNGNVTRTAMPGASVDFTYDVRNFLQSVSRSNTVSGTYGYDQLGRLLSITEQSGANTLVSRTLTYDATGRVVSQAAETGQALATTSSTAAFDAANRITASGGSTFTHDADGNRLSEASVAGNTIYTWDSRGRLTGMQEPGGIITTFLYDYDGNLIQKRVVTSSSDRIEQYVLDDMTNVVSQEQVGAGTSSLLTGRGIDQHWAVISAGAPAFSLTDQLGSTVAVTDGSGAVTGRAFYEPYGATTETGSTYPFQFTGRVRIGGGLYYFRERYLDTRNGRFLSEDPEDVNVATTSLYSYVGGDPLSMTDPQGRFAILIPILINGLVGFGMDVAWQTLVEGKPLKCVNWTNAIAAGVTSAAFSGVMAGVTRLAMRPGGYALGKMTFLKEGVKKADGYVNHQIFKSGPNPNFRLEWATRPNMWGMPHFHPWNPNVHIPLPPLSGTPIGAAFGANSGPADCGCDQ